MNEKRNELVASVHVGMTTLEGFELAQRAAKLLSSSSLVPQDYRGNLPNCVVALNMAQRMKADPLMVMQNLYVVHGTPAWSSQFMIAAFNQCGRFSAIAYEFSGERNTDSWGCRASATERETGNRVDGAEITIALAKAEGWYQKSGSKWKTMPEQMLRYRAAAWMIRANAPELAMGFQTSDEVHDVYDAKQGGDGTFRVSGISADSDGVVIDPLREKMAAAVSNVSVAEETQSGLSEAFSESREPTSESGPETHADWPQRDGDGDGAGHTAAGEALTTVSSIRSRLNCVQSLKPRMPRPLNPQSKTAPAPPRQISPWQSDVQRQRKIVTTSKTFSEIAMRTPRH